MGMFTKHKSQNKFMGVVSRQNRQNRQNRQKCFHFSAGILPGTISNMLC